MIKKAVELEPANGAYLESTELYDPAANRWGFAGPLSGPRGAHTASLLGDGRVLVTGGWGAGDTYSSAEIYQPAPLSAATAQPGATSPVASGPAATDAALTVSPLAASRSALTRLEKVWPFLVAPVVLLLGIVSFSFVRRRRRI